ncbi:MAG: arsenate reductase ArsC [Anaerolineales bacterium]
MSEKSRVLFVCIENSCRSQMAEAFAHIYAQDLIQAFSAGSRPSGHVDPKAVASMAELGYDLGSHTSKSLNYIHKVKYDYVITMGCGDECPFIPADHHEDWDLPDPKLLPMEAFRQVRDQIGERVKELAARIEGSTDAKK